MFWSVLRICVWEILTTLNWRLIWATTITIWYLKYIASQLWQLLTWLITLSFQLHWFWSILVSHYRMVCTQRSRCFTWALVGKFLLMFLLQNLCFYLTCVILGPFKYMLDGFIIIIVDDILLYFLLTNMMFLSFWTFLWRLRISTTIFWILCTSQ